MRTTDYGKINEIQETLCQAITQIVKSELKAINCDTTLKCTVINDTGYNYNYYVVSCGGSQYVAYGREDSRYYVGDVVYVVVPNGNYNEQKFIIGKGYDNSEPYFNPLKNFIKVKEHKISNMVGLVANGSEQLIPLQPSHDVASWVDALNLSYLKGRDITHLALTGNFTTMLSGCKSGVFGIKIILDYFDSRNKLKQEITYFLNTDMYGNVYTLDNTVQKYFLTLSYLDIKEIKDLSFWLYQQSDFKTIDNKSFQIENEGNKISNIILRDFSVAIGYKSTDIKENNIIAIANTDQTYSIEDQIDRIDWVFVTKDLDSGNFSRWNHASNNALNFTVLVYDPEFDYKMEAATPFERESWREDKEVIHFDDIKQINYIPVYGNIKQDKVGFEIILYKTDSFGDPIVLAQQKFIYNKKEGT